MALWRCETGSGHAQTGPAPQPGWVVWRLGWVSGVAHIWRRRTQLGSTCVLISSPPAHSSLSSIWPTPRHLDVLHTPWIPCVPNLAHLLLRVAYPPTLCAQSLWKAPPYIKWSIGARKPRNINTGSEKSLAWVEAMEIVLYNGDKQGLRSEKTYLAVYKSCELGKQLSISELLCCLPEMWISAQPHSLLSTKWNKEHNVFSTEIG